MPLPRSARTSSPPPRPGCRPRSCRDCAETVPEERAGRCCRGRAEIWRRGRADRLVLQVKLPLELRLHLYQLRGLPRRAGEVKVSLWMMGRVVAATIDTDGNGHHGAFDTKLWTVVPKCITLFTPDSRNISSKQMTAAIRIVFSRSMIFVSFLHIFFSVWRYLLADHPLVRKRESSQRF